ncbi:MAG TPA: pirin family protein [Gemmatimonadaceae bacterium]|jgi:redox-sensitive bicupin YhaK (pirin superfamily)|nr:pirin family protein [Gemmatimonadaceae bacterium]
MSLQPNYEPEVAATGGAVELTIEARIRSLGEFDVRRVLPVAKRRSVGPFVFFDHMGPAVFPPGKGIAVRPHPHIGLATITYLFEGEIMHRDSLGYAQLIQEGAVNLMTAGRGIVHSERASDDLHVTSHLHGIQSWMALPLELEEMAPSFIHYPAATLPDVTVDGCAVRVIMGSAFGRDSPVATYSPTLYMEVGMPKGARFVLPAEHSERAAYVVTGAVRIDAQDHTDGVMAVARAGAILTLTALADSRVMVIGGEPLGERHIWWNFVSSSRERIERGKRDWLEGRIGKVAGDDEFIPLPDN